MLSSRSEGVLQWNVMKLFSGSSHPTLAQNIAKELKTKLGKVTLKTFSCGEQYVRYEESIRGKSVFIVQTGTPLRPAGLRGAGRNSDSDIVEICLMCQAAKLGFAASIHLVMPHFPYARQDRVAAPREPISAKLVADLLVTAGADHVITLTLHSDQIQGFFGVPVDSLSTHGLFVEYFRKKKLPHPVVVSPDAGGAKAAKKFADALGADLAIMHKSRPEHQKAEIIHVVGTIEGKTAILFDDMIDTGGSVIAAKKALLKHGAHPDIYLAATHAIFSGDAVKHLREAKFKEVVVTDSIALAGKKFPGLKVCSIAPLLAEVIRHVESGQSVTEIYK